MERLLQQIREAISRAFASEDYISRRDAILKEGQAEQQQYTRALQEQAEAANFVIQFSASGVALIPLVEGKTLSQEQYVSLPQEVRKEIDVRRTTLMESVERTMGQIRELALRTQESIRQLNRNVGEFVLTSVFRDEEREFQNIPDVVRFFEQLRQYTLEHLALFRDGQQEADEQSPQTPAMAQSNPFLPFKINVFVDNSTATKPPVVLESNPTWVNLFGHIERRTFMGAYFSDHTMLRPGSVHHANGGYLVLNAQDLLINPGVWQGLKRIIRNREVRLEDPIEQLGFLMPQGLRPHPMPVNLKVIVVGDERLYRLLSVYDQEDFWEMFKVKAEFDHQIGISEENLQAYASFICGICQTEQLRHFDRTGAARIIEEAARLVSDQTKLSARFGQIKDLLIEADYWAAKDGTERIGAKHVAQAVSEKIYRLNLIEERIREMIADGTVMVDVDGEVEGQVNGLAVYNLGDFIFGRPSRITARTFVGRRGVINIERESKLSGRIHDKGVLILSGYLGHKYAQDMPLSLSASLCFEQSYEGVEGDSASSTELYAILSSLSGLPIKQGIAVTGSVNQKGEVQPIGGVNQKIEGFFDICRVKGLTGRQGVLIPHQNEKHLMLREDVVQAVREGKFHIWSIGSIDEGIFILTGKNAGEAQEDGSYPDGTVNFLVKKRLKELAQALQAGKSSEPLEEDVKGEEEEN
jgi:predicted ATP-dependent protease